MGLPDLSAIEPCKTLASSSFGAPHQNSRPPRPLEARPEMGCAPDHECWHVGLAPWPVTLPAAKQPLPQKCAGRLDPHCLAAQGLVT